MRVEGLMRPLSIGLANLVYNMRAERMHTMQAAIARLLGTARAMPMVRMNRPMLSSLGAPPTRKFGSSRE